MAERLFSAGRSEAAEEAFKAETVGLVEHSAFVEKRQTVEQRVLQQQLEAKRKAESAALARREEKRRKQTEQRRKQSKLTFDVDDEEEEEEEEQQQQQQGHEEEQKRAESGAAAGEHDAAPAAAKRPRLGKCPDVPTDFLPDRDREAEEARLRAQLKEEYLLEVARVKAEPLDITYSYWDGGGHRRCVTVTKGASIGEFLSACLAQLAPEFRALRAARVEHLMYIKEDLILPHHVTFYHLIVNKARGKSGPLFHFDVRDDVRLLNDATREKEESHAGKVCERAWFERSKHIFPASRWEAYDERVALSGRGYTVHGHEVR